MDAQQQAMLQAQQELQQQQQQQQQQSSEQSLGGILTSVRGVKREMTAQSEELRQLSSILTGQQLTLSIKEFNGKASEFREWIKSIEKWAHIQKFPTEKCKMIAYQSSRGVVSDFIDRFLKGEGSFSDNTWETLKVQLRLRFGELQDEVQALAHLTKMKQGKQESAAVFGERIYILSKDAFPEGTESAPIQRQLVSIMINGLSNKSVKFKLLRENPSTLADAITVASTEETVRKRYDLHFGSKHTDHETDQRDEQPMEVEAVRDRVCFKCRRPGHRARYCRQVQEVRQVDSNVQCWHCNQRGHIRRDCPNRRRGRLN